LIRNLVDAEKDSGFAAARRPGMTETVFPLPSLRGASRRSNPVRARRTFSLDCFAEPVIGLRHSAAKTRVNALLARTRWLAMTGMT